MRTLPLLENRKSGGDKVKDFLGEGDYQPTGQGEETLRTLGGIMALEGQADLYDTPAQQDHTDGTNQGENECGKVVYYSERIAAGCKGSSGKAAGTQLQHIVSDSVFSPLSIFDGRLDAGGLGFSPKCVWISKRYACKTSHRLGKYHAGIRARHVHLIP